MTNCKNWDEEIFTCKPLKASDFSDCKNCKYTDEYCASGDCNKISLTEQWKKGELPSGWYYYGIHNETDVIGCDKLKMYRNRRDIKDDIEVLAEVPNYVEWRNMVNCACEEHEANHRLLEENARLKELLKECSYRIDWRTKTGHKPSDDRTQKLFDEIDQVLRS